MQPFYYSNLTSFELNSLLNKDLYKTNKNIIFYTVSEEKNIEIVGQKLEKPEAYIFLEVPEFLFKGKLITSGLLHYSFHQNIDFIVSTGSDLNFFLNSLDQSRLKTNIFMLTNLISGYDGINFLFDFYNNCGSDKHYFVSGLPRGKSKIYFNKRRSAHFIIILTSDIKFYQHFETSFWEEEGQEFTITQSFPNYIAEIQMQKAVDYISYLLKIKNPSLLNKKFENYSLQLQTYKNSTVFIAMKLDIAKSSHHLYTSIPVYAYQKARLAYFSKSFFVLYSRKLLKKISSKTGILFLDEILKSHLPSASKQLSGMTGIFTEYSGFQVVNGMITLTNGDLSFIEL